MKSNMYQALEKLKVGSYLLAFASGFYFVHTDKTINITCKHFLLYITYAYIYTIHGMLENTGQQPKYF